MILAVDSRLLLFRLWHSNPHAPVAPRFANAINRCAEKAGATEIVLAWEAGKTFRHRLFPAYKADRKPVSSALSSQFQGALDHPSLNGAPVLVSPNYEGDDVLASVAAFCVEMAKPCAILTADKDLLSLVRPGVCVVQPWTKDFWCGTEYVAREWGVSPNAIPDVLAIAGDVSDGIPGVPGIGRAGACEMIAKHGSLEGVLFGPEKGRKYDAVRAMEADVLLYRTLATLRSDAPLKWRPKGYERRGA